jgi:hypothetical protein
LDIQYDTRVAQQVPETAAPHSETEVLSAGIDWVRIFPIGLRRETLLVVLRGALEQLEIGANGDEHIAL